MKYLPPFQFELQNGSIQSHYLNMPTGIVMEIERLPRIGQPLHFINTLARIIDDLDICLLAADGGRRAPSPKPPSAGVGLDSLRGPGRPRGDGFNH